MPPIMPMSALMSALRGAGRQHLTASTVTAGRKVVTGSHVFRLRDYTQEIMKKVPNGKPLGSATFGVGGNNWRIMCYPNGTDREHEGYTSLFLKVDNPFGLGGATARIQASVLDRAGNPWRTKATGDPTYSVWGWQDFVKNDDLEEALVDDCLTVMCDVTVDDQSFRTEEVTAAPPEPTAATPAPFDLHLRGPLAEAIWSKHPADVMVHVDGFKIAAHWWVLEAVSPVFKAALENTSELRITDMDADVFKTVFQSVYTDAALHETHELEVPTMALRVLMAADRYGMEKLKLACGEVLCARVDMGMLALAERHGSAVLKDACIKFLSCDGNLTSFMATDDFQQLKKDCPTAALDIVAGQFP